MVVWNNEFIEEAKKLTEPELGLKIIATFDKNDFPHLTMISFNKAKSPNQIVWGQFTEGRSKKHILDNPKQGYFYLTATTPFKFVQAKGDYKFNQKGGEDCEEFSRGAMLRYMTYTNVHTTYYSDVVAATGVQSMGMFGIVKGFLTDLIAKGGLKNKQAEEKLPDFGLDVFNQMTSVKVVAFIDTDGYPVIIPVMSLRAPDKSKLIFPFSQFGKQLKKVPKDGKVAAYGLVSTGLELTSLMTKGIYKGTKKSRGFNYGIIDITEVYNSMPPLSGVIYPELDVRPKVTSFPDM